MARNGKRPWQGAPHSVGTSKAAENIATSTQRASRTRRAETALFVLREAKRLDLRVGTDGHDLIFAPPKGMPSESYFSFQRAIIAHREEVIDIILRGNVS
jgi:hypothetical protein